jgi:rubrerythrin
MTTNDFFKLAERVEGLSRELYLALADHGSTPPGVRDLFLGLAEEEEQHAKRLGLLASSLRGSTWATQVMKSAAEGMRAAAAEYGSFLVEARSRRRPGDLLEILDRLVAMEDRLAFVHAEELAKGTEPKVARLFEALAKQDRRHRRLLERARQGQSVRAPA